MRREGRRDEPATLGTYNPLHPTFQETGESPSNITESVELLFPGVQRSTLVQIIENQFKPTNIYRLLATEKERAESQRTINIGGIEFEQTERDGKKSEYKMSGFFKEWAAYSGILVKLAPQALQGELATALFIYTMNLYDFLENTHGIESRRIIFSFTEKELPQERVYTTQASGDILIANSSLQDALLTHTSHAHNGLRPRTA